MVTVAYTVELLPDVGWEEAMEQFKKVVALSDRDDNRMKACRGLVPFDGTRRVIYLCDFETFEDSNEWGQHISAEHTSAIEEGRKYFEGNFTTTRYWAL